YTRSTTQRTNDADLRADLDSVIGLQLNYSPTRNLELVAQATFSALDSSANAGNYIGLAFAAWRPHSDWTVRVGRVNLDAYLYSDHRDVGFTYPFIRPPVEFYSRMPTSLDGGDVTRYWVRGDAQWQAKLFAGRTAGGTGDSRLKLWPLQGLMVSRESRGLLLRVSAVHARTDEAMRALEPLLAGLRQIQMVPVEQVAADAARMESSLMKAGMKMNYLAAAAAYDRNDWLMSMEVNRARIDADNASFTTGYASIGRRFGPFTAFVMESAALRDADARLAPDWATPLASVDLALAQQAQALADGATRALNGMAGHQFTTSAGIRWDVAPRLALKAQWDHVRSRANGSGLWRDDDGRPAHADIVALSADFVF